MSKNYAKAKLNNKSNILIMFSFMHFNLKYEKYSSIVITTVVSKKAKL